MYQALYRKYRPRTFSDVAGQEHVTLTLQRQIMSGRQSHAYIFVGTRGTGKTTCAKIFSRAINCLNPVNGDPCNECVSCKGIENGSILDVLELDAASNNGIDDVRALRGEAIYSPATVNKRVYIIDEAHMLSTPAFNALLKILEEPPEHLVFILATTALHKVPATILSRCQRFSFKRISAAAIIERLRFVAKNEGLTLTDDAASELASLADGSMRDAISLLDQCASDSNVDLQRVVDTIGYVERREVLNLAEAVTARDTISALNILERVYSDGRDMASLLSEMASLFRDVLVNKLAPDSPLQSGGFSRKGLSALSPKLSHERLFSYLDIIREAVVSLSRGVNIKLTVEMSLIRMCDERLSDDVPALLSRIARLESTGVSAGSQVQETEAGGQEKDAAKPQNEEPDDIELSIQSAEPQEQVLSAQSAEPQEQVLSAQSAEPQEQVLSAQSAEPQEQVLSDQSAEPQEQVLSDQSAEPLSPDSNALIPDPNTDFWHGVLDHLRSDVSIYMLLSDSSRVQAELQGNVLVINAGDVFTVSLIESKKFSEPIMEYIRSVLGPDAALRVVTGGDNSGERKTKSVDELGKFGVVEFE